MFWRELWVTGKKAMSYDPENYELVFLTKKRRIRILKSRLITGQNLVVSKFFRIFAAKFVIWVSQITSKTVYQSSNLEIMARTRTMNPIHQRESHQYDNNNIGIYIRLLHDVSGDKNEIIWWCGVFFVSLPQNMRRFLADNAA